MEAMLKLREAIINIIKRYETPMVLFAKFIVGIVVYTIIFNIGHASSTFEFLTTGTFFLGLMVALATLFIILPLNANYLIMIFCVTLQLSAQLEIAIVVFMALLAMFLFYGQIGRKENVLILATVLGFHFNIPYFVPIFAGLYFGFTSIIPITLGVFIWAYSGMIAGFLNAGTSSENFLAIDIDEIMEAFFGLYESLSVDSTVIQQSIMVSAILCVVMFFVYIVSKLSINYNKEIAIFLGTAINLFGFLVISIMSDTGLNPLNIAVFSILSGVIMYFINFFDVVLEYEKARRVEFEDEDFYYYVKVIPKKKTIEQKKAKSIEDDEYDDLKNYRRPVQRGSGRSS